MLEIPLSRSVGVFGVDVKDLGVHSLRKGTASYVISGSTCGPHQVAINIRVGWKMGQIQDTFLQI